MTKLVRIYEENPNEREIDKVVEVLKKGGIIIYPTDTVYGIGCDIHHHKAVEKLCKVKGIKAEKTLFAFIFNDLKHIAAYSILPTSVFKILKRTLPGPFTFILKASSLVPKILKAKKKTIGIRIPDNNIVRAIVQELGNPIITTSIIADEEYPESNTNPELIYENFKNKVDAVVDGGIGNLLESTIVDCVDESFEIFREGAGDIDLIY